MQNIPTYIYYNILSSIINHLLFSLRYGKYFELFFANSTRNEIIKYATISKKSFQIVSYELTNNLNIDNYKLLKFFFESPFSYNNNNNNNDYKLIKLKDSIIIYNDTFEDFKNEIALGHTEKYKNIIFINDNPSEFRGIISELSRLPDNTQLYLLVCFENDAEFLLNGGLNTLKEKNLKKIKRITIDYGNPNIIYRILNTNIKDIIYCDTLENGFDCEIIFDGSPTRAIEIDDLFYTEGNQKTVNQGCSLSKLEKLTVESRLEVLIERVHKKRIEMAKKLESNHQDAQIENAEDNSDGEDNNNNNNDDNEKITPNIDYSYKKDLDYIVEKLSNDPALNSISLSHFCSLGLSCQSCNGTLEGINIPTIFQGLNTLFSNPNTKLENLKLYLGGNSLDANIVQGLSNNRSIKNLGIAVGYFEDIITKVLVENRNQTIRNLTVFITSHHDVVSSLALLRAHSQDIDLYSVTFIDNRLTDLSKIKKVISGSHDNGNYSVSEINIISFSYITLKKEFFTTQHNNTKFKLIF
ncbi:expressed protein [Dictyostelium purpureum]|uniref:Expressed protein n=1 Tax=Dictyostelium purpureum TaxID=5786 RepID=F0ZNJ4_DICPU|nr:uncharacterized protein DICPUDRAFT_98199 [Dictyostelium purpureum]EGC34496.1 expressed protein [Dictyostelium purpureum]|eukprot:XP_003288985.1 expressed protein [Dictyostelium purpureum]